MKRLLQTLFTASILGTILFLFILSLGSGWVYPQVMPNSLTLSNWWFLFSAQGVILHAVWQSLLISLLVAAVATSLAFVTSKAIAYHRNRQRWLLLAYIPYVLSPVILAATLQFYFVYLGWSGSLPGVLLAQFFIVYPFGVIILNNFWNERTRALEQLASTLGCTRWQTFFFTPYCLPQKEPCCSAFSRLFWFLGLNLA